MERSDDPALDALAETYETGYRRFLRVAEAIVRDAALAEDVVQDSFARAVRSHATYRGAGDLDAWIWRIVLNTARTAAREHGRRDVPLPELDSLRPSSNGNAPVSDMRTVLATLPERQRLVLFLRYYADLDYRTIAAALGIRPGTVGATLNQAHAALRHSFEEVSP